MLTRRDFVISAGLSLAALPHLSRAAAANPRRLVFITLRGGMDGLTALPPLGDPSLARRRPDLWTRNYLETGTDFGLHPSLPTLHRLWRRGEAAAVHATGLPYTGRSHFEGQNLLETGGVKPFADKTGWLGRAMKLAGMTGLALSLPMPLILRGLEEGDAQRPSFAALPSARLIAHVMNDFADVPEVRDAFASLLRRRRAGGMPPSSGDEWNDYVKPAELARVAARELGRPDGPRVAVFDFAGFDTHAGQGAATGDHADKLARLDALIEVLADGLPPAVWRQTLIVAATEFGRNVAQNGSYGTDHGWGSAVLLAGGVVSKAQVFADWPGLGRADLFEGRDLAATIDQRAVFAAAISATLGLDHRTITTRGVFEAQLPDLAPALFRV